MPLDGARSATGKLLMMNFFIIVPLLGPAADKLGIGDSVTDLPDGAMIMVVGYASTTGQADTNRKLSSDRATEVAANIDMAKPGKQVVQAVFLGQTKRFSSRIPERNQVCEVWQINPK